MSTTDLEKWPNFSNIKNNHATSLISFCQSVPIHNKWILEHSALKTWLCCFWVFPSSCTSFPAQSSSVCLFIQAWLGHSPHTVKTSGPVSRKRTTRWGRLQRAVRGERETPLHKQGSAWPPSLGSPRGPRSSGTEESLEKKHNPPHSTKTNKQGHPNFSIRARGGGQETDQCSLSPTIPQPSSANSVEVKEIHRDLWALTEGWGLFWHVCRHKWWRSSTTTRSCDMAPACNWPVNQFLSVPPTHNQSVEQTHSVRFCFSWESPLRESVF